MDGRGFDSLTRRLAARLSRRSVVQGIVGTSAAVAVTRMAAPVGAAPQAKVDICHYDADTGTYKRINVNGNALDAHLGHGDVLAGDGIVIASLVLDATNRHPVDTGVFIGDGESVTVTITGEATWCGTCVMMNANGSAPCGIWGTGGRPSLFCGSVVGAIGGGNIFVDPSNFDLIGTGPKTVTASGTSGTLVLQYVDGNNSDTVYGDNRGTFVVTITRTC